MVQVLKTIGFDRHYVRAEGAYLYDKEGQRYLDLLSGFGVFAIGRNHPTVKRALADVLAGDLADLVQMDVSPLAGMLAEKLIARMPGQERVFFCNSGTEAVEAAIKLSRQATGRAKLVFCDHAFHGLTMGALSLNGDAIFREGFGPLLADAVRVPWNDLPALEAVACSGRRGRLHRRADPGQGGQPAGARLSRRGGAALSPARDPVRRRRGADGARPHRDVPGHAGRERRSRSGARRQGALGRLRAGRRRRRQEVDLRQDVRPDGPRRRARLDVRQEQPGHGRRPRHAAGARRREADRKRRPAGRPA